MPEPARCEDILPSRIGEVYRVVAYIAVGVYASFQPDRIAFDISPGARIVVAEPVLVQPVLDIEILPREAQIGERGEGLLLGLAEGAQHRVPGERLARVGGLLRRIEMVGVDEVEVAAGDQRERHVVEPDILGLRRTGGTIALGEEMARAVVDEMRDG